MSDYDVWRSLKTYRDGSGIVSRTQTNWCHNCFCNTETYFENHNGYIMYWCAKCGKRKW